MRKKNPSSLAESSLGTLLGHRNQGICIRYLWKEGLVPKNKINHLLIIILLTID